MQYTSKVNVRRLPAHTSHLHTAALCNRERERERGTIVGCFPCVPVGPARTMQHPTCGQWTAEARPRHRGHCLVNTAAVLSGSFIRLWGYWKLRR